MNRSSPHPRRRRPRRRPDLRAAIGVVLAVVVVLMWSGTTGTLSGWSSGVFVNSGDTVAAGKMVITHSAGGCTLGPRVTAGVACSGSVVGTETVTNGGDIAGSALTARVKAASCAAVKFDNPATSADVLLARNNPDFQVADPWGATNAVALDGSSYASGVAKLTEAVPTSGNAHGVGVWFKAGSTQSGPLLSFGPNPTATAGATGTDDQSIVLNANGTLSFYWYSSTAVYTTNGAFNNGAWHFAYMRFVPGTNQVTFTVSVDSTQATGTTVAKAYPTTNTGYWRLGWAPTTLTGQSTTYFTGALSNAVVFWSTTSAPATPPTTTNLSSQANFTSWATSASDRWLLGDTGTTTYSGSQPTIGTTSPCTYVDIVWSFTNPTATAVTSMKLSAFATGTAYSVSAMPDPGVSQSSNLTITRDSTYNAYVTGLRLYVPFSYIAQTTAGSWPLTFSWTSDSSVVVPS